MIREHAFNSEWWGGPVAFVEDRGFFRLPSSERGRLLAPFAWAEFRAPLDAAPPFENLLRAGFRYADTQIHFRLALPKVPRDPGLGDLSVRSAAQKPFEVGPADFTPFGIERYRLLPGMSDSRLSLRYTRWAGLLAREDPEWCLEVLAGTEVQGWFLSRMGADHKLNLTLAMTSRGGHVSGLHVYQSALVAYAGMGARVGWASFSASNTPVLNIYAHLGARFLPASGCWLWWPGSSELSAGEDT